MRTATCTLEMARLPTKERPRFDRRTGIAYTPKRTRDAEKAVRDAWIDQVGRRWQGYEGEVRMLLVVERPLPKSAPKRRIGEPDMSTPDLDNVLKAVGDALNGLAYKDDRQMTQARVVRLPRPPHRRFCRIRIRISYR